MEGVPTKKVGTADLPDAP